MTEYLFAALREPLRKHVSIDTDYEASFNRFEYFVALTVLDMTHDQDGWFPPGRFAYLLRYQDNIVNQCRAEVSRLGVSWPPLQAGLFGGSIERFNAAEATLLDYLERQRWLVV